MDHALFTTDEGRRRIAEEFLSPWMPDRRWFGGKARKPRGWRIAAHTAMGTSWMLAVEVTYADGSTETYAVPLRLVGEDAALPPGAIVRRTAGVMLIDATYDAGFRAALFDAMAGRGESGLRCDPVAMPLFQQAAPASRVLDADQSNTSILYGDSLFVKLYRKLIRGVNPEVEVTRFLTRIAGFAHAPPFCGAVEWRGCALALGVKPVAHRCNGWALALEEHRQFAEKGGAMDRWIALARLLGRRTGGMHRALAGHASLPDFAPEPFTTEDSAGLVERIGRAAVGLRESLRMGMEQLHPEIRALATEAIGRLGVLVIHPPAAVHAVKIRVHGDYHLGQVLFTGKDFVITDFEGEPARSIDERRSRQPALRDVAGMLRSFHYAAHGEAGPAESWAMRSQAAFLDGWNVAVAGSVVGSGEADTRELLRLFLLEKVIYEVGYEMDNRPDWLEIPLRGVLVLA